MIYKRIKELRLEHGLSQSEVAKALGMSVTAYRNLENGKTILKTPRFIALANLFNVPIDYVAELTDQKERW